MHFCQQLSGIQAVLFYADEVLNTLNIQNTLPFTMGIGGVLVMSTAKFEK